MQPLLGIAVLALVLKIPGLMRGSGGGGTLVASLIGSAAGAVVGGGTSRLVMGALGSAGARATAARAAAPRAGASQLTLPMSVGVRAGNGNEQLSLPMSVSQSANQNA